jgi:CHAD domain-containing protein
MAEPRVKRKQFARRYRERAKALMSFASELPERPSPDQIHDLRVTARRIQVMRRLLPRQQRSSQESKRFGAALKSVMRATSQLRDLDTLIVTLGAHRQELPAGLFLNLENQRSDAAASSGESIKALADTPPPELDPSSVRGKKLSKRLGNRLSTHGGSIADLLPKIVEDEANIQELHKLRIEAKKLRYLLELDAGSPPELPIMTRWQDFLGAIHDLDVAVAYLEEKGIEPGAEVIREIKRSRHLAYLKFVNEHEGKSLDVRRGIKVSEGESPNP